MGQRSLESPCNLNTSQGQNRPCLHNCASEPGACCLHIRECALVCAVAVWRSFIRRKEGEGAVRQASRRGGRTHQLYVHARLGRILPGAFRAVLSIGGKLKPLTLALQLFLEAQQRWLRYALAKAACWAALLSGLSIVAANTWAVPAINRRLLPMAANHAAAILQREVRTPHFPGSHLCWTSVAPARNCCAAVRQLQSFFHCLPPWLQLLAQPGAALSVSHKALLHG